jgi:hypothetical protein
MIKLINILQEIANTPYQLQSPQEHKSGNFDNYVDYNFKTNTGREYYIRFSSKWEGESKPKDQKYNWKTELTFFPKEQNTPYEVGGENFGQILATVIEALKRYIDTYKPEHIFWKGIKTDVDKNSNPEESTKRQRIYNLVMDRETKQFTEYSSYKGTRSSGLIYKETIPVKDANKLFTYPANPSFYDEKKAQQKMSRFNLSR